MFNDYHEGFKYSGAFRPLSTIIILNLGSFAEHGIPAALLITPGNTGGSISLGCVTSPEDFTENILHQGLSVLFVFLPVAVVFDQLSKTMRAKCIRQRGLLGVSHLFLSVI